MSPENAAVRRGAAICHSFHRISEVLKLQSSPSFFLFSTSWKCLLLVSRFELQSHPFALWNCAYLLDVNCDRLMATMPPFFEVSLLICSFKICLPLYDQFAQKLRAIILKYKVPPPVIFTLSI